MTGGFREWSRTYSSAWIAAICFAGAMVGCQVRGPATQERENCSQIEKRFNASDRIEALNVLSAAFKARCDDVMVAYGAQAQAQFRHKSFSVARETANVFVPDGTFIDYVLESYERAYLGLLMAASYTRLHKFGEAKVELRVIDHELFAPIYNYGEDPVNLLLSAVLWEKLGEIREARVDWLRLRDLPYLTKQDDEKLRRFAADRVKEIDRGEGGGSSWQVYQIGRFPELDWDLQFTKSTSGYFSITPKQPFMQSCASATGLRLSTESWFNKIAIRHSHAYHPLLNVQTWIRLPLGLTYSVIPLSAGAGVMVGGCMLDAAGKGKGALCELAIQGGIAMMLTAPLVLEGSLRPDLRHWEQVPAAFVVTRAAERNQEPCLGQVPAEAQRML